MSANIALLMFARAATRDGEITVRNAVLSAGAGFVVPLLGDILRMPGLSADPQAHRIDLVDGEVVNLR